MTKPIVYKGTRTALLLLAMALAPATAGAADIDPVYVEEPGTTPVEFASGWYLRGDIGAFHGSGDVSYPVGGQGSFGTGDWLANPSLSVGVGYIWNDNLRGDITLTHFGGLQFDGSTDFFDCPAPYNGECRNIDTGELSSTALQANVYLSLAPMGNFKPYAGAGLGIAYQSFDVDTLYRCRLDPGEDCAIATHSGGAGTENWVATSLDSRETSATAIALSAMLGTDYRVDDHWTVDLGYKFTTQFGVSASADADPMADLMNIHELRVGLRYEIW